MSVAEAVIPNPRTRVAAIQAALLSRPTTEVPLAATRWWAVGGAFLVVFAILALLPSRSAIPPLVESDYCYQLIAAERMSAGLGPTSLQPVAPLQPWEWQYDWGFLTQWPVGYPLMVWAVRQTTGVGTIAACQWISVAMCALALVGWFTWVKRAVPRGICGTLLSAVAAACSVSAAMLINPSTDAILVAVLPFTLLGTVLAVERIALLRGADGLGITSYRAATHSAVAPIAVIPTSMPGRGSNTPAPLEGMRGVARPLEVPLRASGALRTARPEPKDVSELAEELETSVVTSRTSVRPSGSLRGGSAVAEHLSTATGEPWEESWSTYTTVAPISPAKTSVRGGFPAMQTAPPNPDDLCSNSAASSFPPLERGGLGGGFPVIPGHSACTNGGLRGVRPTSEIHARARGELRRGRGTEDDSLAYVGIADLSQKLDADGRLAGSATLWLILAGLLAGGLFWIRYAGVFVPLGIGVWLLVQWAGRRRMTWRPFALFSAAAAVPILGLIILNCVMGAGSTQAQLNLGHTIGFHFGPGMLGEAWWNFTEFGFYDYHWYSHWLFALWPAALLAIGLCFARTRRALRVFASSPAVSLSGCLALALFAVLIGATSVFGDKFDYVALGRYYQPIKPLYFLLFAAPVLLIPQRTIRVAAGAAMLVACAWIVQQDWPRPYQRWLAADRETAPSGRWARCFAPDASGLYSWLQEQAAPELILVSNFHEHITFETGLATLPIPETPAALDRWVRNISTSRNVDDPRVLFVLAPDNKWRDYWIAKPEEVVRIFGLSRHVPTTSASPAWVFQYRPGPKQLAAVSPNIGS